MTLAFKLTTKLEKVVDLAVVGDPDAAILVAHWHMAIGGQIQNSQTAASEADVRPVAQTPVPYSGIVGPAVGLDRIHPRQSFAIPAIH